MLHMRHEFCKTQKNRKSRVACVAWSLFRNCYVTCSIGFQFYKHAARVACEIRALSPLASSKPHAGEFDGRLRTFTTPKIFEQECQKLEFQGGIVSELSRPTGMHLPYPYHRKGPIFHATDATRVSRVAAGKGGDFPCYTCYIGARPRRATSKLHGRAARVARRIGSLGAAGLAVLCSTCSRQNRGVRGAGLAVLWTNRGFGGAGFAVPCSICSM